MKMLLLLVALAALSPLSAAQQKPARPAPADPAAPAPPMKYVPPLAGYVPYRDQEVAAWRDANDEAARAGGHAGIFRGAAHGGHVPAKPSAKPHK